MFPKINEIAAVATSALLRCYDSLPVSQTCWPAVQLPGYKWGFYFISILAYNQIEYIYLMILAHLTIIQLTYK